MYTRVLSQGFNIRALFMCLLAFVFGLVLVTNLVFIVKGLKEPDTPPSVFGVTPMIVLSASMSGSQEGHLEVGDLAFVKDVDDQGLKVGDIISFKLGEGLSVTTHRIVDVSKDVDGELSFQTKGDANNTVDDDLVAIDQVLGVYLFRIPKLGNFALFLHEPLARVVFIGIPVFVFLMYDLIRKYIYSNIENEKTAMLEAEIIRLKAQIEINQSSGT